MVPLDLMIKCVSLLSAVIFVSCMSEQFVWSALGLDNTDILRPTCMVNENVNLNNLLLDAGCRLLMISDKHMHSLKKNYK